MNASTLSLVFAGFSVSTAAVFHIIGLVNAEKARKLTLQTRQAEYMQKIYERMNSPEYWPQFQEVLHEWKWESYSEFVEKYGPANPKKWRQVWLVGGLWEHLGLLVRDGIIDPALVWHWCGAFPITLWNKLEPVINEYREREEPEPKGMVFEWFEDLIVLLRRERAADRKSFPARRAQREAEKERAAAEGS